MTCLRYWQDLAPNKFDFFPEIESTLKTLKIYYLGADSQQWKQGIQNSKKKKKGKNPNLNQNTVSGNIAGINAETPKVSACKRQH